MSADMDAINWRGWTTWLDEPSHDNEVRVVRLAHGKPTDEGLETSRDILSDEELARAGALKVPAAMARFVVTRAVLRTFLGMFCRQEPKAVPLGEGDFGKPKVLGEGDAGGVRFNVSHSQDWSLLVFATGREVGVDIEAIDGDMDAMGVARRFFGKSEMELLEEMSEEAAQRQTIFMLWAQREALAKADGGGLSDAVFEPSLVPLSLGQRVVTMGERDWSLQSLALAPGHAVALAVEGGGEMELSYWQAPRLIA